MTLFGFNYHADALGDEARALDWARRVRARSHLSMHGAAFGRKLYDIAGQASGQPPIIVLRDDYPDQDWRRFNEVELARNWPGRGGYWPDAYIYYLNEPICNNDDDVRSLLTSISRFIHACVDHRLKAVVGNFADASLFTRERVDSGIFDDALREWSQWTNEGHGYIGHHNYTYGSLAHGGGGVNPWDLAKPEKLQREQWPGPERMQVEGQGAEANWLQMRFMWVLNRCDRLGIPRYKMGLTEGLWDDMPNGRVEGWIQAAEGLIGGRKLRGPLDQRDLWPRWWPQWTPAQAAIRQMEWLASVLPPQVEFVHLYAWTKRPDWATFDFSAWPEFLEEMQRYAEDGPARAALPDVPQPKGRGHRRVLTTIPSDFVNVRKGPATDYDVRGQLLPGAEVLYYGEQNGWAYVKTPDTAGWVSLQGGKVVFERPGRSGRPLPTIGPLVVSSEQPARVPDQPVRVPDQPATGGPLWVRRVVAVPGPINVRAEPSTQPEVVILGEVVENDVVEIIEDRAFRRGIWIPIRFNGQEGWISGAVVTFKRELPVQVDLSVQHYSQIGPNATKRNDCGPACVAMILRSYGFDVTSDALYEFLPHLAEGSFTSFADLSVIGRNYNIDFTYFDYLGNVAYANLLQALADGYPSICLVNYEKLNPDHEFDGPHFVVVGGYTPDEVLILDPLRSSGPVRVPTAQFVASWGAFEPGMNPDWACAIPSRKLDPRPDNSAAAATIDLDRVRRAAFNITTGFESGGRYDSYQTYDAGGISYGRFQFTLASGNLTALVERYLQKSPNAALQEYLPRLRARDGALRDDAQLKNLLQMLAQDPAMRQAQEDAATERFWLPVYDRSVKPRQIRLPLSLAFMFDVAIQRGQQHLVVVTAEDQLGVPRHSLVQDERVLIRKSAEIHRDWLHKQAERDNLPGLKPRGDFWLQLVERGDWDLQGEDDGLITLKQGLRVPVRSP